MNDAHAIPEALTPRHSWVGELEQYRLKIQLFSSVPPEVTIQKIDFSPEFQRYQRAYENGQTRVSTYRRKRDPSAAPDPESVERSQRRAKTRCRLHVVELAPNSLVTFTTRETLTPGQLLWVWQRFTKYLRDASIDHEYVVVPEPHPSNPSHLHLHAAWRGKVNRNLLRRFWHMALEARHGRRVTAALRGSDAPGNIDDQPIKARGHYKRIRKIAKYISKYITKAMISAFNKRRYWPSKGINVEAAKTFWLHGLSQVEAIREACILIGEWDHAAGAPTHRLFRPSDRLCWFAIDPDACPPPPA